MKNLILYFLTVFIFGFNSLVKAQTNLVPNPSFESYTICPNSTAQLNCTGNWLFGQGSTDYFNSCETTNFVSVPSNLHGFQNAYDGNAYIGMYNYDRVVKTYREPAVTALVQSLLIGQKYHVSFKTVLTIDSFASCCATNKIGALFSTVAFSALNPAPIHNFAHIYTDSIISDTLNWKTVYGSFIADSAYTYITLGNFFDSLNIQVIDYLNNYQSSTASYYFVDDIKVSTDSMFVTTTKQNKTKQNSILVYPNPCSNGIINIANVEKLKQLDLEIYDSIGQLVFRYLDLKNLNINVSILNEGLYNIILSENQVQIFRQTLIINK